MRSWVVGWLSLLAAVAALAGAAGEFAVTEPAAAGLSAQRLERMEQSIRGGDFKQGHQRAAGTRWPAGV